jgi:transposase-like protein
MGTSPLGPPCPKCQSQATELANFKAKRLSGSKIAAGVMTMGMSCLATGVSTKQKATWVCKVCKNSFTVKA